MGTTLQSDKTFGIKKESVYGTPVTVAAHIPVLDHSLVKNIDPLYSAGMRSGKVTDRQDGVVDGKVECVGDVTFEVTTKDSTTLLEAWLGKVTTGGTGTYFHLFQPAGADDPPSYTIQTGIPLLGGGAQQPHTFEGMCVQSGELTVGADGIMQLKLTWTGQDMLTATSFVTPAYTASQQLFSFRQTTGMAIGGTVTHASGTAAATGGTAVTNVRDFSLSWDNALDPGGWNLGGAGLRVRSPKYGKREGSGTFTAEFDSTTYRDAYLAGTILPLLLTAATADGSQLQIDIPAIKILPGSMASGASGGDVITASCAFKVLEDGANPPLLIQVKNTAAT